MKKKNLDMIKNIKMLLSCTVLLSLSIQFSYAQKTKTYIEKLKMSNQWFYNTNNAAGLQLDNIEYYSQLEAFYNYTNGDYKFAQEGKKNTGYGFYTDGGGNVKSLKNAFAWGSFNYSRTKKRDAEYNASLIDPLRGTPFFIADDNKSNWINQNYNLSMKLASPIMFDHFILGISANYINSIGAKQIDPRPEVLLSKIQVIPSIVYFTGKHSIGLDFNYNSRREDGTASNSINLFNQTVWEFVAPGYFQKGEIGGNGLSGLRNYNANAMGGGLQYGYKLGKGQVLLSGNYLYKVEDVTNSYSVPKFVGTTKDITYDIKLNVKYNFNASNLLLAELSYSDRSLDGIEYIQIYNNDFENASWDVIAKNIRSNFDTKNTKLQLDYFKSNDNGLAYNWKAHLDVNLQDYSYIYYIPKSTEDVTNLYINLGLNKNFKLESNSLNVGFHTGYKFNQDKGLSYTGVHADSQAYTDFTLRDYDYLSSDNFRLGADVTFNFNSLVQGASSLFTKLTADYYKANDDLDLFDNRTFLNLTIGLIF
ncbi:MAG: DUF6850 family outer membrane beta-barrel protein [Bacteroidales bacterium]